MGFWNPNEWLYWKAVIYNLMITKQRVKITVTHEMGNARLTSMEDGLVLMWWLNWGQIPKGDIEYMKHCMLLSNTLTPISCFCQQLRLQCASLCHITCSDVQLGFHNQSGRCICGCTRVQKKCGWVGFLHVNTLACKIPFSCRNTFCNMDKYPPPTVIQPS